MDKPVIRELDLQFTEVTSADGDHGAPLPLTLEVAGSEVPISRITDRWYGRDHCYFKVVSPDENVYLLRYDQIALIWECRTLTT